MRYVQTDILRVAKRVNNTKRSYLLVNPLQAKHIPVSPTQALEMMETLGGQLAQKYPGTKLVIGFAETATAIGAAAASRLGPECLYLHTTREPVPEVETWALFSEEHSHAVEQKLCGDRLEARLKETEWVILVDDEISTGKTLRNMVRKLREQYPGFGEKRLVAASLLNRVSPEDEQRMLEAGLHSEWLVKVTGEDPAGTAAAFQVEEAEPAKGAENTFSHSELDSPSLPDPRRGTPIHRYQEHCQKMAGAFWTFAASALRGLERIVVLGTEECMYPALVLGRELEHRGYSVQCHATTRSPIGLCAAPGYPITSGKKLSSFYEAERDTYLYNFAPCDALIVVSDAPTYRQEALNELTAAWAPWGCGQIYLLQGGRNVWYLSEL